VPVSVLLLLASLLLLLMLLLLLVLVPSQLPSSPTWWQGMACCLGPAGHGDMPVQELFVNIGYFATLTKRAW
jgi:hypothetical protein